MSILVSNSNTTTYNVKLAEIKKLIAADLGQKEENVTVKYVVQNTSDERYGSYNSYEVTGIEVTVKNSVK